MKAKDIMTRPVITISTKAAVPEIARALIQNSISGVPVVDDDNKLVGVVTEGDLLRKETNPRLPNYVNLLGAVIYYNGVERYHEDFKKLMAGDAGSIMTAAVISVSEEADVTDVAQLLLTHGIKRVPVVTADGHLAGIISRADIIKLLLPVAD